MTLNHYEVIDKTIAEMERLRALEARVAKLEGVIQTQNGVVVSGTLKLNEARARVARLEALLQEYVSGESYYELEARARAALEDAP